jgi:hypothetical protein
MKVVLINGKWVMWNFHRGGYAVAEREELEVEVENILGKEVGELEGKDDGVK